MTKYSKGDRGTGQKSRRNNIVELKDYESKRKFIKDGQVKPGTMKRMLIHSIAADDFMQGLGVNSKLNADWEFLSHLRDVGRAEAKAWLVRNFEHLARRSTTDLDLYL
jgi:NTE family protein